MVTRKQIQEVFRHMGKKGGKARTDMMTPEERRDLAKKAAKARWAKRSKPKGEKDH